MAFPFPLGLFVIVKSLFMPSTAGRSVTSFIVPGADADGLSNPPAGTATGLAGAIGAVATGAIGAGAGAGAGTAGFFLNKFPNMRLYNHII